MILLPTVILHRVHLVEKEKAEQKTKLLEKKLAGTNELTRYMNTKGQEDTVDSFMIKVRINCDYFWKKQGFYYFVLLQEIIGNWVLCVSFLRRVRGGGAARLPGRLSEGGRGRKCEEGPQVSGILRKRLEGLELWGAGEVVVRK